MGDIPELFVLRRLSHQFWISSWLITRATSSTAVVSSSFSTGGVKELDPNCRNSGTEFMMWYLMTELHLFRSRLDNLGVSSDFWFLILFLISEVILAIPSSNGALGMYGCCTARLVVEGELPDIMERKVSLMSCVSRFLLTVIMKILRSKIMIS